MKPAQKFIVLRPWGLRVKGQVIELMGIEAEERLSMNWVKRYVAEKPKATPKPKPVVEAVEEVVIEVTDEPSVEPVVEEATIDKAQVQAATAYHSKHSKRGKRN